MITHNRQRIYMMGIGGIAMGNIAGWLQEKGYHVEGSERGLYSPMKEFLTARNIPVHIPYDEANIKNARPDLVIIGNVIRADNPEARWVVESGLSYMSMPEAINHLMLDHHLSLVVAGTHGKSTTTALLLWVLSEAGLDPSGLVGALIRGYGKGYRSGNGPFAVIEGDEYDTAFFDKRPKFIHYKPYGAIITGIEFDHADIYRDIDAIRKAFEQFVVLMPSDGVLVLRHEDPYAQRLRKICRGRVITYGVNPQADWKLISWEPRGTSSLVTISGKGRGVWSFPVNLIGEHNALNALATAALLDALGIEIDRVIPGFANYPGLKRRQEILLNERGPIIVDDFAHHPTAVKETIKAVKAHFPNKRLIVIFEPRTNTSKRSYFQDDYAEAFHGAGLVLLKAPPDYNELPENNRLDFPLLVARLRNSGIGAHWRVSADEIMGLALKLTEQKDLILCMSNGDMDGIPVKLTEHFARWP